MHMTELESRLAEPEGPALRDSLLQQLEALRWRLRQQLQASLPREDFATHQAAADAVQAACEVLRGWPMPVDAAPQVAPHARSPALQFPPSVHRRVS
jgi:hypothetical protein